MKIIVNAKNEILESEKQKSLLELRNAEYEVTMQQLRNKTNEYEIEIKDYKTKIQDLTLHLDIKTEKYKEILKKHYKCQMMK